MKRIFTVLLVWFTGALASSDALGRALTCDSDAHIAVPFDGRQLSYVAHDWHRLLDALEGEAWEESVMRPVAQELTLSLTYSVLRANRTSSAPIAGVELLEAFLAFAKLKQIVSTEVIASQAVYFPSAAINAECPLKTQMIAWEQELLRRWEASDPLSDQEFVRKVEEVTGKEARETATLFFELLPLVIQNDEERLWQGLSDRLLPRVRRERTELLAQLRPLLENALLRAAWENDQPVNLWVEAGEGGLACATGKALNVSYAYHLESEVPRTLSVLLRDARGRVVGQKLVRAPASSGEITLPSIRTPGPYTLSVSVRTDCGLQATQETPLVFRR